MASASSAMFRTTNQLLRFRGLLVTLVSRELKARYRGSALGYFWSLVNPLLLLVVYTFVFGFILKARFAGTEPYALFLMVGLFPWVWVSTSLLEGAQSLIANSGLIRKAVFPTMILPMVSVLSNLVHFILALPVLAAAFAVGRWMGYPVGGPGVVALPLVLVLHLFAVGGAAAGLSALNAHFKDVRDIVANVLTLLFYLTPVIYPLEFVAQYPRLEWGIRWLNPFTPFTVAYQAVLFAGELPTSLTWAMMLGWAVLAWTLGSALFERLSDSLVEAV